MEKQEELIKVSHLKGACAAEHSEDADRLDPDEVVTGCFDFRTRTRSFDLHQLGGSRLKKKFTHLFHSSSDGSIKPTAISSAPATPPTGRSPRCSPQRRRLVRVVRDVEPEQYGEENPHVVHKYSEAYLQSKQSRQRSMSESDQNAERVLPYEVTGHTILKKPSLDHSSSIGSGSGGGGDGEIASSGSKHASFRDEVVVIEFDRKCKVVESSDRDVTRTVLLHDSVFEDADSFEACQRFEDFAISQTIAALSTEMAPKTLFAIVEILLLRGIVPSTSVSSGWECNLIQILVHIIHVFCSHGLVVRSGLSVVIPRSKKLTFDRFRNGNLATFIH